MTNRIVKLFTLALATTLVTTITSSAATAGTTNTAGAQQDRRFAGRPRRGQRQGVEIKRSQLDTEMLNVQQMAAAQRQQIPPDRLMLIEREKLNDLIGFQLLLAKATDADKARARNNSKGARAVEEKTTNSPMPRSTKTFRAT